MTTKPKARKFRIRRSGATSPGEQPAQQQGTAAEPGSTPMQRQSAQPQQTAPTSAQQTAATVQQRQRHAQAAAPQTSPIGTATQPRPSAAAPQPRQQVTAPSGQQGQPVRAGQVSSQAEMAASTDIDDIRREGLTGRQLRMARRLAHRHGLAPTSDFDAVRLLRAKGIDPFQKTGLVELVPTGDAAANESGKTQLPQTIPVQKVQVPSTDVSTAERRARDILEIQRDISRRRRRKLVLMLSRLAAFILLPTLVVGYYFYLVATPMYSTKSEFLILTADGSGTSPAAGLLSGTAFATGQDSIATQSYLESKDAMLRLDRDVGFRDHFSGDNIDVIQRLDPDASNEAAYKVYKKYVKLGYDTTEGVIRMELSTPDPMVSQELSKTLIDYAEERVDQLSQEKRRDGLKTAQQSLDEAQAYRRSVQAQLVELQEVTILDPEGEIASIRGLMQNAETQLQEKELALNIQLNNLRPNSAKVEALRSEIAVLKAELVKQSDRLNKATEGDSSLASKAAEIQMAQADLMTADMVLQSALETKRQSEIEANKQVRYLTVSVEPLASQDPSFPRKFESTLVAFLIFSGIYLMVSITVSILREQIS